MISIGWIIYILFCHFVSDFVFQTDKQAINKSTSFKFLLSHILTYIGGMLVGIALATVFFPGVSLYHLPTFVVVNGLAHLATDFFTSKITSYLWKAQKRHLFFVTIGFDQFLHTAFLLATLFML